MGQSKEEQAGAGSGAEGGYFICIKTLFLDLFVMEKFKHTK